MATRRASSLRSAAVVAAVALLVAWWQARDAAQSSSAPPIAAPTEASRPAPPPSPPAAPPAPPRAPPTSAPAPARLDLSAIPDPDERAAIVAVVEAIDRGGPFAYRKDGAIFENREKRLPPQPRGYWREYTVPTPDEDDRGARRLVAGRRRELRYTRDHYRSFVIVRGPTP
jgi:ribonuclease T1